jgi:exopolyphosphatase/guanosine-5'-triphosphate,3'-diphosphate pyrophosphatase
MLSFRRAVVDVGTNSVKLLVADAQGREVRPVWEESRQTRLGRGFYPSQTLQPDAIAATATAIKDFVAKADEFGAAPPRIVATSATREARNQTDLISAIKQSCGLPVRVITGEQEASYGFQGITSDPGLTNKPLLLLDVGGGSTQLILGQDNHTSFVRSLQMGAVRLLERARPDDPPSREQLLECRRSIRQLLEKELNRDLTHAGLKRDTPPGETSCPVQLVGTGGTASILGCIEAQLTSFDREKLEATKLNRDRVRWHVERFWGLTEAERRKIVGLPSNRADVILTGSAIYEGVMDYLEFQQLRLSTRGLRFGILMEPG